MSSETPRRVKSMRTPFSRVRYMGASHSGTRDFWHQRAQALARMTMTELKNEQPAAASQWRGR
jgi:succinate dehydrogenase / fumarate reductase, membrane anchor subunit